VHASQYNDVIMHTRYKSGETAFRQLCSAIAEHASNASVTGAPEAAVAIARADVPDMVHAMRARDIIAIHMYLMYLTDMRPDARWPAYEYTGGDRIMAVCKYLQRHMELVLATCYI